MCPKVPLQHRRPRHRESAPDVARLGSSPGRLREGRARSARRAHQRLVRAGAPNITVRSVVGRRSRVSPTPSVPNSKQRLRRRRPERRQSAVCRTGRARAPPTRCRIRPSPPPPTPGGPGAGTRTPPPPSPRCRRTAFGCRTNRKGPRGVRVPVQGHRDVTCRTPIACVRKFLLAQCL